MNLLQHIETTLQPQLHFEYFTDFARHHIKSMQSGLALNNGKKFSASTIRQYKATIDYFEEFENFLGKKIATNEMFVDVAEGFERYLISKDIVKNTIAVYISKIKALLSVGFKKRLFLWNGSGLSVKKEKTTKVKLSTAELHEIRLQAKTDYEQRCVDIFTLQFFTGMRYDTLCKFLDSPYAYIRHEQGISYIEITADKNDEQQVIPISVMVNSILNKHNYKLKRMDRSNLCVKLKELAKRAELNQPIAFRQTKNAKMNEEIRPKYTDIATHTAKRSFVTHFSLQGTQLSKVSAMTGNKDEKQLAEYNRSSKLEQVIDLIDNEFFKTEV